MSKNWDFSPDNSKSIGFRLNNHDIERLNRILKKEKCDNMSYIVRRFVIEGIDLYEKNEPSFR